MENEQKQRKLASIQKIEKLEPIEGADMIEVATVLGWHCVVKKGEFKEGDLCVYFEVDSLLPRIPQFDFLSKGSTPKTMNIDGKEYTGYRLKTVKLRGQISQGLALPLKSFGEILVLHDLDSEPGTTKIFPGSDVTKLLDIVKYEPPIPAQLAGKVKGQFPGFIPKTDEIRIQSVPEIVEKYSGTQFYATEKLDGSSVTIYIKGPDFGVCSRNLDLLETEDNSMWKVVREMNLETQLRKLQEVNNKDFALQGEIIGEGIQGNPYNLRGQKIYFYSLYNITDGKYVDLIDLQATCSSLRVPMVPKILNDFSMHNMTVDKLVEIATRKSMLNPNHDAEGLVFRPMQEMQDELIGRLSFKVINPEFLLKEE